MSTDNYTPPKVWKNEKENGGVFASINRPVAGPTHQKDLPRGRHPLQLYSQGTWNGIKVTILLEELLAAGFNAAEYDAWMIDISQGDQFGSGFVELNPNSKIPALIDYGVYKPVRVFESGAILLYWQRSSIASSPKALWRAWIVSLGCFGRWAAHLILEGASPTFTATPRSKSNMPSIGIRWR
jgi:hypothetical protein